ncbi:hypothetical protein [Phycicoccus flavus]|uniref:hypothetical protein n=1 Tax=Phycicoccus flavus TaxID=2502783 RepID=UPI000FEB8520|nr:hypothetical protein [Phycicoccus flavus]NHA66826.1 hypothetical protein [Phycicoccus flavus]
MDVTVGLVSGTTFRVPSPAVREAFGLGTLTEPLRAARLAVTGLPADAVRGGETRRRTRRTLELAAGPVTPQMAERAQAILDEEDALTSLHRVSYPPATPPEPLLVRADGPGSARSRGLARWIDRATRRHAAADAPTASVEPAELVEAGGPVDAAPGPVTWWDALTGNDPETVIARLGEVFAEAGLPATPTTVVGGYAEVAVLAPGEHVLPAQSVGLTAGGVLSIRRPSAERRASLHRQVVAGVVVAAVHRALAAAPGLTVVRVVVVRARHRGHHADVSPVAVLEVTRASLEAADLGPDAETVLSRVADALRWQVDGLTGELRALPLDDVPEIAPLLARLCRFVDEEPRALEPERATAFA